MLRCYRDQSRFVAGLLLAALASLAAATAAPHADDCHEALCVADVVDHDVADHSFEALPAPGDHELHCIVCHWIRAFKPAIQSTQAAAPSVPDAVPVQPPFSGALSAFRAAQPPLRSPPFTPALITL